MDSEIKETVLKFDEHKFHHSRESKLEGKAKTNKKKVSKTVYQGEKVLMIFILNFLSKIRHFDYKSEE